ncbi:FAD-dependent thymidylate synthase [Sphingomonas sp. HF-S3]|uniref:Flavin-dependent thymidylate synthase n=1 Tax=Sphingomonas rustica TaxID=3103142 RepID=A0ABV0B636_9SPHN
MTSGTPDAEIMVARAQMSETRRPTVAALEAILQIEHRVLDHGFVRVIDYMGDDGAIVQAARVSYGRGTKKVSEDRALIRYLMRHWHSTPFEMCEIKLHVKLPIFVARQWVRHRTANINEYSARYSILDREFYTPSREHLAAQTTINRQGRGAVLEEEQAARVLHLLREDAERSYATYRQLLNDPDDPDHDADRTGLARELARIGLGLSTYTQWYWKTDLHNLFGFLRLRADPHAQFEIRIYAELIRDIVRQWVPVSCEAFEDYRMNAVSLSAAEADVVRKVLAGTTLSRPQNISTREWSEFATRFGIIGA